MSQKKLAQKTFLQRGKLFSLILFAWLFLLALLYTKASNEMSAEEKRLNQLLSQRTTEYIQAKEYNSCLKEQLSSLSDPAAGEFALIEELGVIPSGTRKVLIQSSQTDVVK